MAIWTAGRMVELYYNCFISFFSQYVVVTPTWCLCWRETQEDSIQKEQKIHFWRKTLRTPSHLSTADRWKDWTDCTTRVECAFSPRGCEIHVKQRIQINNGTKKDLRSLQKKVDIQNGTQTNDLDVEHCPLTECTSQIGISRDNDLIFISFSLEDI